MDFLNVRLPLQKKLGANKDYIAKLYPVAGGKSLAVQYDLPANVGGGVSIVFTHHYKDVAVKAFNDTELSFFHDYYKSYCSWEILEVTPTGNRYFLHNN